MIDLKSPTTLEEISKTLNISRQAVQEKARKGGWPHTTEHMAGKNKRRLYELKDLPQDIQYAVLCKRRDDDISQFYNEQLYNEQQARIKSNESSQSDGIQASPDAGGNAEIPDRLRPAARNSIRGQSSLADMANPCSSVRTTGKQGRNDCLTEQAEKNPMGQDSGGAAMADGYRSPCDAGLDRFLSGPVCEENPERARDTGFEASHSLDATLEQSGVRLADQNTAREVVGQETNLSGFCQKQRAPHNAITIIMRWLAAHPSGKQAKALRDLNHQYAAKKLPGTMMDALDHCKQKSSGKAKTHDILVKSTVENWKVRFKEKGNYIPDVRQKDRTIKPWHVDLVAMLEKNPQKKPVIWMVEQLQAKYGKGISEYMVYRYINGDFSQGDLIKGENSGMQLRAKQAYQPRTSAGLLPWEEVHADGWATHFTAPHPVTGDFVTYEVWDFHDVATRYVPPFGIGLTECFEVIAKGVENAVRDHGVMCILQTDSTKIVKNNAKFTGDPVKSISDKAGITIVHPKTVGNAQANGIAENFHAWLDKESRVLATYQASGQDSLTLRNVKKITAKMVKAANMGELELWDKLKAQAEKVGGGVVFISYHEAVSWLENIRIKWNNKPHRALKKVRDNETQKLRHQTPLECLNEFKANGWEPVMMDETILVDLFLVHKLVTVKRGMVKPYGGMMFRHPELAHWEGKKVHVAYDSMNYEQVWVKDLKGRLICIAPFLEPTGYRSVSAYEAAEETRAKAQIRNKERQIETIKAKAGIVEHNVIDATPSPGRLKVVQDDGVGAIEPPLKPVDFEPAQTEDEAAPMGLLELWGMLLSEEDDDEELDPKDGTAGL